ncbi:MAG TPA: biotin-dependent carboxyltransferase family protein [Bryobacteraceae bacterium]|nr:biotin-dependent carboxyltransferase family protein [Bryobacteraceae bacterium]
MNSTLTVEAAGLFTTVQDLGRAGYAHLGISLAGAADTLALRIGNLLVGNDANAPALEMTASGGSFRFEHDAVVALTGATCDAPMWRPFETRHVRLGPLAGARSYLCVRGGIDVPLVLGSASMHPATGIGGRPLRRGDVLRLGSRAVHDARWAGTPWRPQCGGRLRVTAGPQSDWFDNGVFFSSVYKVDPDSNRAGLRLRGAAIEAPRAQLLTEGVSLGAVQVPAGGQPIVLFVDQTTTGGYPKIANVVTADLWRVGQLRPGDEVSFELVSIEHALKLLREQERMLAKLL